MIENGRAGKLSMLSWDRHKFRRRTQRRVISTENGGHKGGSAAGVARASADQYFISTSATSDRHSIPFPRASCRLLVPYPSSFAASLATSRICVSPSFIPHRVFPRFPASPPLTPRFLRFRLIRSLRRPSLAFFFFFSLCFKPRWLCHRAESNCSRVRDVLHYDPLMATTGAFKNSQLIARGAKVKSAGDPNCPSCSVKLSFTRRNSKLEITDYRLSCFTRRDTNV